MAIFKWHAMIHHLATLGNYASVPRLFRGESVPFDIQELITSGFLTTGELQYIKFNLDPTALQGEGVMYWNKDDGTLNLGMPGGTVNLQIGQEQLVRARNDDTVNFTNGHVVYVSGSTGAKPNVKLADNTVAVSALSTIGVTTEAFNTNHYGYVNTFGYVRGINTIGLTEGALIWLGTNGDLTSTKPTAPAMSVAMGLCLRQNAVDGVIFVRPVVVPRLSMLSDVYAPSQLNGGVLTWSETNLRYEYRYFYQDMQYAIESGKVPAVNSPTWSTFLTNLSAYTFAVNDYIDMGSQEVPHDYVEGTGLSVHIHFANNGTDTTARGVKWQIEYTIVNADTSSPFKSIFPPTTAISAEATLQAKIAANNHILLGIGTISNTGIKIGAQIKMRLKRIAATGTAPTANPFALQVGIHYQCNTLGSNSIGAK